MNKLMPFLPKNSITMIFNWKWNAFDELDLKNTSNGEISMEERSTTNQLRIPNRKIGFAQKEGSFDLDLRRNPQK